MALIKFLHMFNLQTDNIFLIFYPILQNLFKIIEQPIS